MDYINGITVIIPTYNRKELLYKTLLSLCFQSVDQNQYEVIVVDDGSTDGSQEVVTSYNDRLSIRYFYQEDKGFRVAKARNTGIENAYFSTCLFLDSGIIASPDLIKTHISYHQKKSNLALIGHVLGFKEFEASEHKYSTDFTSESELRSIFSGAQQDEEQQDCRIRSMKRFGISFNDISIPWIIFWMGHVSCATKSLKQLGGFDENFQSWGGEDVELGIRLYKSGFTFKIADEAKTIHCSHEKSVSDSKRSSLANCQYIFNLHPSKATQLLSMGTSGWESVVLALNEHAEDRCYA